MSASNLISACEAGRLSEVISLVTNGQDVNMKSDGRTPLMWAISGKHWDIVRWLLGVRTLVISQTSNNGWTVLHLACRCGASSEIINMIVTMMDSKISNAKDNGGDTAIVLAVVSNNQPAVKYLGGLPGIVWDYQTLVMWARAGLSGQEEQDMLALLKRIKQERKGKGWLGGLLGGWMGIDKGTGAQNETETNKEEDDEERKRRLERVNLEQERERKEQERMAEEENQRKEEAEKNKKEEMKQARMQREVEKKKEEEQIEEERRSQEKLRIEKERQEKVNEEEKQREYEAEIKRKEEEEKRQYQEERKIKEKEDRKRQEDQESKEYQVDEKIFAQVHCKKGSPAEVSKYLAHNPDLLNSLQGSPLRMAALGRNIKVIEVLMENTALDVNQRDSNNRSALHMATSTDVPTIVQKFLDHRSIDVNPVSKTGLTPVMEATKNGKIESLKVLLEDDRVDLDIEGEDGKTIENMLEKDLAPHKIASARKFFLDARQRRAIKDGTIRRNKVAIIIINCDYSQSDFSSLEGPKHDLKIAKKIFEEKGYQVHVIEDSQNILIDVTDLMLDQEMKESTDIIQIFFSGHGIHKTTAEKGLFNTGNKKEAEYRQEGEFGDCLVNTDGTLCEELLLSSEVAVELNTDALMCFFYDCCRNERKDATQKKETVIVSSFQYKQKAQKSGADRRMVKIFSTQLGETSEGLGSFFHKICKQVEVSSPRGMKLLEMMYLEHEDQKCQIECGPGWDDKWWPLE